MKNEIAFVFVFMTLDYAFGKKGILSLLVNIGWK